MANNQKMWALLVYLSSGQTRKAQTSMTETYDDSFWDYVVEEAAKSGINTILFEVDNAVELGSHPEIAVEGAWSRRRMRKEIARCRELGITLIPKFNFSTGHCYWLGEYRNKISTIEYYKLCNDIIKEVYELFDHPKYIHLGMDEEDARHVAYAPLAVYRQKDLYWHDLRFLIDCVADTGAKAWITSCPLFHNPEEFPKRIEPDEVIISPWQYHGLYKEHYTRIDSRQEYIDYYKKPPYCNMNLTYVEDEPYQVLYMEQALPNIKKGYCYFPTVSVYNKHRYNALDTLRYYKENAPDEQMIGYLTAPWFLVKWENKDKFDESFRLLKEAKEKYYG